MFDLAVAAEHWPASAPPASRPASAGDRRRKCRASGPPGARPRVLAQDPRLERRLVFSSSIATTPSAVSIAMPRGSTPPRRRRPSPRRTARPERRASPRSARPPAPRARSAARPPRRAGTARCRPLVRRASAAATCRARTPRDRRRASRRSRRRRDEQGRARASAPRLFYHDAPTAKYHDLLLLPPRMRRPGLAPLMTSALFVGLTWRSASASTNLASTGTNSCTSASPATWRSATAFPSRWPGHGATRGHQCAATTCCSCPSWLVTEPAAAYRAALAVNSLVSSVTPVAASWRAGRLRPELSAVPPMTIGALVGLYPPFLIYSTWAMAENVLVPALLLACVAAARASERRDWAAWLVFGAANGLLYVFHARCAPIVMAAALVASRQLWPLRQSARPMGAFLAGLGLGLSPSWVPHALAAQAATRRRCSPPRTRAESYLATGALIGLAGQVGGQVSPPSRRPPACSSSAWERASPPFADRGRAQAGGACSLCRAVLRRNALASVFTTTFLAGNRACSSFGRHGEHILAPALVVDSVAAPDFRAATSALGRPACSRSRSPRRSTDRPRARSRSHTDVVQRARALPFIGWLGRFSLGAVWLAAAGAMLAVLLARLRRRAGALACASLFLAEAAIVSVATFAHRRLCEQASAFARRRGRVTRRLGVPRAGRLRRRALALPPLQLRVLPAGPSNAADRLARSSASPAPASGPARAEGVPGAPCPARTRAVLPVGSCAGRCRRAEQAGLLLPPGFPRLPDAVPLAAALRARPREPWETSQTAARDRAHQHAGGGSPGRARRRWRGRPTLCASACPPRGARPSTLSRRGVDLPARLPGESADVEIDPRAVTPVRPLARGTHYRVVIGPLQESVGWFFEKGDTLLPLSIRW